MKNGNWKLDWIYNSHRNMVLNDEGSFLPGSGFFDCLEDNGQNQLPLGRPNIGQVHNLEEGLQELEILCIELQFEGGAEADQDVSASYASYESDVSQVSGRDGECEVILSDGGDQEEQNADNMDAEPGEASLIEEADMFASSNPEDMDDYHYEEDHNTEDETLSTSTGEELDSGEEPETNAANDEPASRDRFASLSATSGSSASANLGLKLKADMDKKRRLRGEILRVERAQLQHLQSHTEDNDADLNEGIARACPNQCWTRDEAITDSERRLKAKMLAALLEPAADAMAMADRLLEPPSAV